MWVRASLDTMPPWNHLQLADASAVEQIAVAETADWKHTMAWMDKTHHIVRARTFAPDWERVEAEGNGSGALLLAAQLGHAIEIRHGEGSVIYTRPAGSGFADIGGRVRTEKTFNI